MPTCLHATKGPYIVCDTLCQLNSSLILNAGLLSTHPVHIFALISNLITKFNNSLTYNDLLSNVTKSFIK